MPYAQANDRQVLLDIANAFAATQEAGTLVRVLVDILTRTLHPQRISVYQRTDDPDKFICIGTTHFTKIRSYPSMLFPPLLTYARDTDDVIVAEAFLNGPAPQDQIGQWMLACESALAIPLISGGELYGVVLLGEKCDGNAYRADEIGLLHLIGKQAAVAFGNARHYAELRWMNTELEQVVHERTKELAAAIEQLQQADRAKDKFLAILSHELLNPLTSVLAWIEVAEGQDNPEMTEKSLGVIRENANRQQRLISDLLDTSRIVHEKMELDRELFDLWSCIEQCIEEFCHSGIIERYFITINPPPHELSVLADRMRLQQVVTNLLHNAVKFTDPGGSITISGSVRDECAVISVEDTGRGIPPECLSTIFNPFIQAQRDSANCGLGLGLALVHSLVSLHGGRVQAESDGVGKGSRFTVFLPLAESSCVQREREDLTIAQ